MTLAASMQSGDIIIDGGNSFYKDDVRRAKALAPKGSTMSTPAPAEACGASSAVTV